MLAAKAKEKTQYAISNVEQSSSFHNLKQSVYNKIDDASPKFGSIEVEVESLYVLKLVEQLLTDGYEVQILTRTNRAFNLSISWCNDVSIASISRACQHLIKEHSGEQS